MKHRKAETEEKKELGKRSRAGDVHLKPAGEVRIEPAEAPAEPPEGKRIHERRPLPLVPEGPDRQEHE